ncbi:Transketolase, partial [Durusdinium trenchii]
AAVEALPACVGVAEGCGTKTCKVDADQFFVEYVENGEMIDDGLLKGLGDTGAGVLALILLGEPSWGMVKLLHILILGKAKAIIRRYLAG